MQPLSTLDQGAGDIVTLLSELKSKPRPLAHDLWNLRHALQEQGPIDRRQAAAIFHANRVIPMLHHGWVEFYLAALTGFFLDYQKDSFVLPERSAAMLLAWLGDDRSIPNGAERRLTLRILRRAAGVPAPFEKCVLDAVLNNLMHETERWSGNGPRYPGIIDALDLHLIRGLVHPAEDRNLKGISSATIAFMLELDRAADRFADMRRWRRLLVECLRHHLCPVPTFEDGVSGGADAGLADRLTALLGDAYTPDEADRLQADVLAAATRMVAVGPIHP